MDIFITGATGFIGSNLVAALAEKGFQSLIGLIRKTSKTTRLQKLQVAMVKGDLTDPESYASAVRPGMVVIHLAGQLGGWGVNSRRLWEVNFGGTQNLLKVCQSAGVRYFIFCSSAGVFGPTAHPVPESSRRYRPVTVYEKSKAAAEDLVRRFCTERKIPFTILRPSFLYGPDDRHVLKLFEVIARGHTWTIGKGTARVTPTYIGDLVQVIWRCLEREPNGKCYHVAGPESLPMQRFVTEIARALGRSPAAKRIPVLAAYGIAGIGEQAASLLNMTPPLTRSQVDFFTRDHVWDGSGCWSTLDYQPTDLKTGLERTVSWYRTYGYLE